MGLFDCVKACLGCFPRKRQSKSSSPVHNAARFNAQLRSNLGLAERPLHLPARVESEQNEMPLHDLPSPVSFSGMTNPTTRAQSQLRVRPSQQQPDWTTSSLTHSELAELFNVLHRTLEHVPYAICGLGALIDHGFTARKASRISIICPAYSKDNVKAWAAARGYPTYADSVGLPMRDGSLRRVRIKYLHEGFERLERARSAIGDATVLSLASQLDSVAAAWLDNRRRGDERALATIAADVSWCLDRAARTRARLDPDSLPTLLGEDFFAPFTERHVGTRPDMARAGIDVSAVLARHRNAAALREHDEMLRAYGFAGDDDDAAATVTTRQPGLFEGLRSLGHSRSVYTLRDRDSRVLEESAAPAPAPMPMPMPELAVPLPALRAEQMKRQLEPEKEKGKDAKKKNSHGKQKDKGKSKEKGTLWFSRKNNNVEIVRDLGRSLTRSTGSKPSVGLNISGPIPLDEGRPSAKWI
ncbi:hypothetical protein F5X99DRAFT_432808 [Biscogniauxia marginata]|nr:hypothetical protein F5X99DRAFT_432808 [Biscogniauxia marginata]